MSVVMVEAFEEWANAPGTWGRYEVSSLGRMKYVPTGHVRPGCVNKNGYRHFQMRVGGRRVKNLLVHRLVCEAFHGPAPLGKNEVRHLDGDRLNNLAENLAWGDHVENEGDKVRHGTRIFGEAHVNSKLTAGDVLEIRRRRAAGEGATVLADEFGISNSMISGLMDGRRWGWLK